MKFKIVPNTLHLSSSPYRWCLLLLNVCGEFYNGFATTPTITTASLILYHLNLNIFWNHRNRGMRDNP